MDTIDALEAKTKIVLDAATEAQDNKQQAIAKAILKNVLKIRKDIDTMEDIDFDVLQTGIDELENLFADKLASQE
ncbi:hypothetical protein GW750_07655 [bacterium]|nr:hypothetical protein [bacterium]